jgi:hypothetical protein
MPLRRTDFSATRKFEDGDAWMVLRVGGLSKGESDLLSDLTGTIKVDAASAQAGLTPDTVEIERKVAQANRMLFVLLCQDWSIGDVTETAYAELDEESGRWVDECIGEVLRERRERAEKNAAISKRPRKPVSSSRKVES